LLTDSGNTKIYVATDTELGYSKYIVEVGDPIYGYAKAFDSRDNAVCYVNNLDKVL
jgi:hypothetical protein